MDFVCISAQRVIRIHDNIIGSHELQGEAPGKSVESAVMRVYNRLNYGLINDIYELAAAYAAAISIAHAFNDANKRTAFATMGLVLKINSAHLQFDAEEAGNKIIQLVLGECDELDLAAWLRKLPQR
ncbi:MAG: type II toxin-antitoxin system death-on-curing family toxin [Gammaproteobacteria bacterium]|nr:type II toxin-antitoxin system death-on-curing family toxin [Gammaproteobacteria bacterium]